MSIAAERESELWEQCARGSITAREELIVSYRPLVYWIAGKIRVHDPELRKDMIQEGMLALIRAVDKFDPKKGFRFTTYAYHKIHGHIINLLERSEKRAPVPVPDEYLDMEYDEEGAADDWIDAEEAISRLEGREAQVLSAMFYEGKKARQIAGENNIDVSHVYRLRRSAIARIRNWLGLEGA